MDLGAIGQVGDEGAMTRYRVYGISDDYVAVDDGERVRRYPFDWNSHGVIVVHFKDAETELRTEWRYHRTETSYRLGEIEDDDRHEIPQWDMSVALVRCQARLMRSPRCRDNRQRADGRTLLRRVP